MKILLICAAGMSTSLVVNKMKEVTKEQGKEYEIEAMAANTAIDVAGDWDVLLFGPQLRFKIPVFKKKFADKPIDAIPPQFYGTANGAAILEIAEKMGGK